MAFKFPFTNYHELNLTWVLDQLKKLFEDSAENVSVIQNYDGRLTAVETELPTVSETASEASRAAAAAATLAQTAKATADTAQENAVQAQSLAGTARQEAQAAQTVADAATQAAQQAQATALNFDGRITQAQNDASQALEASRSFENRVQAAINTANNAASTATTAQGIAVNANQNAATALDKAEAAQTAAATADGKAEAAQTAAATADGKAEAAQTAAATADGKAEAAQTAAANIAESIAPVEESATASQSYAVDELLIYNNRLYKAASFIAQGETLEPGTNIIDTTIDAELDNAGGSGGSSVVVPFPLAEFFPSTLKTATASGRTINVIGNHFEKIRRFGSASKLAFSLFSGSFISGESDGVVRNELQAEDFRTIRAPYLIVKAILSPSGDADINRNFVRIYKRASDETISVYRDVNLLTPSFIPIESDATYAITFYTGSSNGPTDVYLFFDVATQIPT